MQFLVFYMLHKNIWVIIIIERITEILEWIDSILYINKIKIKFVTIKDKQTEYDTTTMATKRFSD